MFCFLSEKFLSFISCQYILVFWYVYSCYCRSQTLVLLTTLVFSRRNTQPLFPTPLEDTLWRGSGRLNALLLRGSLTLSWCTGGTTVRSWWLWGSSSTPWRLSTSWLTPTLFKLSLTPLLTGKSLKLCTLLRVASMNGFLMMFVYWVRQWSTWRCY